ncbi:glucosaminidase domain-containing protein [Nonlabens tegetincola]|uniref:glucosaminidase domain-containing protein n=1 Tax=Nonlabens tegetincola TaxID=323273 RepID=UPI0030C895DC
MSLKFKNLLIIFFGVMLLTSCGGSKKVVTTKKKKTTQTVTQPDSTPQTVGQQEEDKVTKTTKPDSKDKVSTYIDLFANTAMREMKLYKIPASITLAQGILESGSGEGRLAVEANNHFGIKCHKGWTGGRIYHDDDKAQECFRTYNDPDYSYRDHSLFLRDRKRYAGLFKLQPDDYQGWAKGLRAAGYATDRRYPQKLISLIERYELYKYDNMVLGNPTDSKSRTIADVRPSVQASHKVVAGDTLYSISRKYNITVDQLKAFNGLKDNTISVGQELFVEPLPKDF